MNTWTYLQLAPESILAFWAVYLIGYWCWVRLLRRVFG